MSDNYHNKRTAQWRVLEGVAKFILKECSNDLSLVRERGSYLITLYKRERIGNYYVHNPINARFEIQAVGGDQTLNTWHLVYLDGSQMIDLMSPQIARFAPELALQQVKQIHASLKEHLAGKTEAQEEVDMLNKLLGVSIEDGRITIRL